MDRNVYLDRDLNVVCLLTQRSAKKNDEDMSRLNTPNFNQSLRDSVNFQWLLIDTVRKTILEHN